MKRAKLRITLESEEFKASGEISIKKEYIELLKKIASDREAFNRYITHMFTHTIAFLPILAEKAEINKMIKKRKH